MKAKQTLGQEIDILRDKEFEENEKARFGWDGYHTEDALRFARMFRRQRNEAAALLRKVVANHCPNDKLFCGTCSEARDFLARMAQ